MNAGRSSDLMLPARVSADHAEEKKETLSIDQPVMLDDESSIESLEPVVADTDSE